MEAVTAASVIFRNSAIKDSNSETKAIKAWTTTDTTIFTLSVKQICS